MRLLIAATLAIGLLVGCATPYQAGGLAGGFSQTRLADNSYIIRFQGNGYTSAAAVEEMAILRAAELTLEKNFSFFHIVSSDGASSNATYYTPAQSRTTGTVNQYGTFRANTVTSGGAAFNVEIPRITLGILLSNRQQNGNFVFLDAASIVADLGAKYKKP